MFDPLAPVGMVFVVPPDGGEPEFAGTCFLFRSDSYAMTAAHCVPRDLEILCWFPRLSPHPLSVRKVHRHPRADIAALHLEGDLSGATRIERTRLEGVDPAVGFWGLASWGIGQDVWAYGFPAEASFQGGNQPRPRFFKGYVQTVHEYDERYAYSVTHTQPWS
jgi:hypothetical protein